VGEFLLSEIESVATQVGVRDKAVKAWFGAKFSSSSFELPMQVRRFCVLSNFLVLASWKLFCGAGIDTTREV